MAVGIAVDGLFAVAESFRSAGPVRDLRFSRDLGPCPLLFRFQGSQIELGRRMVLEIVEYVVGRVDGLVEIAEAEQRPLLARRLRFRVVVAKIETVPFGIARDLVGSVALTDEDPVVAGVVVITHQNDPVPALIRVDRAVRLVGETDLGPGGSFGPPSEYAVDPDPVAAGLDFSLPRPLRFERKVLCGGLVLTVCEHHVERLVVVVTAVNALGVDDAADLEYRYGVHRRFGVPLQLDGQFHLCRASV